MNTPTVLQHLTLIRFSGRDAGQFLHNQLSADIKALGEGQSTFACLCQPKGRVIALFLVWRRSDHYAVLCSRELGAPVCAWLQRFVFRDQVQIELCDQAKVVGAEGPVAGLAEPLGGLAYGLDTDGTALQEASAGEAFRAIEIEHGIAWLDAASSEQFLPQMLGAGLIGALNFRKGCYPGQEIVARTHYLGKLKQRPVVLRLQGDGPPPEAMSRASLQSLEDNAAPIDAIVVSSARHLDGAWRSFVVARATEAAEVHSLQVAEQHWPVAARWLAVPAQQSRQPAGG